MLILFDNGTPSPLRRSLISHTVKTAYEQGWDRLSNGELLTVAESFGFELVITTDQNIKYQQNLNRRKIAVVVLGKARWPLVRLRIPQIVAAVSASKPGSYLFVEI